MKSAKKLLSIVLCAAMILSMLPAAFAADEATAAATPVSVTYTFNNVTGNTNEAAGGLWEKLPGSLATSMLGGCISCSADTSAATGKGIGMKIYVPAAGEYVATVTRHAYYQATVAVYMSAEEVDIMAARTDAVKLGALPTCGGSGDRIYVMDNHFVAPAAGWYNVAFICTSPRSFITIGALKLDPYVVPVETVTLDNDTINAEVGDEITLNATVAPDNATDKSLTWTSSNENVATVVDGVVTAVANGIAKITATSVSNPEISAECTIKVGADYVPVESISLDKNSLSVEWEQSATLVATVTPDDATKKDVVWSSSNEAVATVVDGVVYGAKVGTATITATSADNAEIKATCEVTVTDIVLPPLPEGDLPAHRTFRYKMSNYSGTLDATSVYGAKNNPDDAEWGFPSTVYPYFNNISVLNSQLWLELRSVGGMIGQYSQAATIKVYVPEAGRYSLKFDSKGYNDYQSAVEIYFASTGASIGQANDFIGILPKGPNEFYSYTAEKYVNVPKPGYYNIYFKGVSDTEQRGSRVYLSDITATKVGSAVPADMKIIISKNNQDIWWELASTNGYVAVGDAAVVKADAVMSARLNGKYATIKLSGIPAGTYYMAATSAVPPNYGCTNVYVYGSTNPEYIDTMMTNGTNLGYITPATATTAAFAEPIVIDETGDYYISFYCLKSEGHQFHINSIALSPEPIYAEEVTLDKETYEAELGEIFNLTATVGPEDATDKGVIWSTSDSSVAKVSQGVVKAMGYGKATITATSLENPELYAECVVTVPAPAVEGISLDLAELEMEIEETATLTATLSPEGAEGEIVWTSDDEDVATVVDGVITAVGAGEATITATVGEVSATCVVTVNASEPEFEQGDINGDNRINTRDVTNLRRYLAGGYEDEITVIPEMVDVNGDGRENTRDVAALRALIAG